MNYCFLTAVSIVLLNIGFASAGEFRCANSKPELSYGRPKPEAPCPMGIYIYESKTLFDDKAAAEAMARGFKESAGGEWTLLGDPIVVPAMTIRGKTQYRVQAYVQRAMKKGLVLPIP